MINSSLCIGIYISIKYEKEKFTSTLILLLPNSNNIIELSFNLLIKLYYFRLMRTS